MGDEADGQATRAGNCSRVQRPVKGGKKVFLAPPRTGPEQVGSTRRRCMPTSSLCCFAGLRGEGSRGEGLMRGGFDTLLFAKKRESGLFRLCRWSSFNTTSTTALTGGTGRKCRRGGKSKDGGKDPRDLPGNYPLGQRESHFRFSRKYQRGDGRERCPEGGGRWEGERESTTWPDVREKRDITIGKTSRGSENCLFPSGRNGEKREGQMRGQSQLFWEIERRTSSDCRESYGPLTEVISLIAARVSVEEKGGRRGFMEQEGEKM